MSMSVWVVLYYLGPGREREAAICMNDFHENHAEEERVCFEFQDFSLNCLQ